jgi:hypothetical protein
MNTTIDNYGTNSVVHMVEWVEALGFLYHDASLVGERSDFLLLSVLLSPVLLLPVLLLPVLLLPVLLLPVLLSPVLLLPV